MEMKTELETKFYPFTNQFTFSMVMRDPVICKGMLDRILPDVNFGEVKNTNEFTDEELRQYLENYFESIETEKTLNLVPNAHGVRFDAQIKGTDKWAEIEMQTHKGEHIGKRARYYLANVDMEVLAKGKPYSELPPSYVIFICTYDDMGKGEPVYSFLYYDPKISLPLGNETYIIILNTKCDPKLVPEQLKPLYAYVNDPGRIEDEFIQQLDERVQQYNSKEWRLVQVTLEHMLKDKEQRDIEKGRAEERERINMLNKRLSEVGRIDDLIKSTTDADFQQQLLAEFNL